MASPVKDPKQHKPLPAPNSDFYEFAADLPAEEMAIVRKVREYMETKVQPIINKYWVEDSFPFELLPSFRELNIAGLGMNGYGCPGGSRLLGGLVAMEMARTDASFATFYGVHSGLAMNSIYLNGTEEQKQKWLPPMARGEKIGCFALTEPLVGSGAGGGLLTTAKRDGDTWILNGQKRWIGNAPWCDISIVWARNLENNQVAGFIVENKTTPGFSVEKMQNKIALKVVQNGEITMKNCRVPDENRLQGGTSTFRDTARVLRGTRHGAAWEITGSQMGAYENALKYAQERLQFGKPIGSFKTSLRRCSATSLPANAWWLAQHSSRTKASLRTSKRRFRRRLRRPSRVRPSPGRESCWAATASSSTTTLRGSSRMPRRSIPTKARIRCST